MLRPASVVVAACPESVALAVARWPQTSSSRRGGSSSGSEGKLVHGVLDPVGSAESSASRAETAALVKVLDMWCVWCGMSVRVPQGERPRARMQKIGFG